MKGRQHRRVVERAWELFVSGASQGLDQVPPIIRDSWIRSKAFGVDPGLTRVPQVIPPDEMEELLCHNDLFQIGQEVIHFMLKALEDSKAVVALCDRTGLGVSLAFGAQVRDKCAEINFSPGSGWGEEHIGTDTGIALRLERPIRIHPGEHYCSGWKDWVTDIIPVYDPFTREVMGALEVDWCSERSHPRIFDLLQWGRQTLESALHSRQLLDRLYLLEQYNAYELRFAADALLAIDRQGHILAANPVMAKLLRQSPHTFVGRPLASILGLKPEDVWKGCTDEFTICLPHTDVPSAVESLPVSRQGREAGGVLVLRPKQRTTKGKIQSGAWQARYTFSDLIGNSPRFQEALAVARAVAATDLPVLLLGESGTGKELLAHAIHTASPRASGSFVPFNCGGVTEELIAAELFGYVEGAFTGAVRGGQPGKIEAAHGGTLFLDEVDEMPVKMQVSLLRVLEDGMVVPVGSTHPHRVDVRLIAATNKDLLQKVAQGTFRADLYYRLSGAVISLPPLRERIDDLPLLAHHILRQAKLSVTLTPEALVLLQSYAWPGNIRELRNVLLRARALTQGPTLTPQDLPPELVSNSQGMRIHAAVELDPFAQAEKACILEALTKAQGAISDAAASLDIHRVTLYRKMRRYGISTQSNDS